LKFALEGTGVEPAIAIEAVKLSQTRYCGVSAMLSRLSPSVTKSWSTAPE